MRSCRSTTSNCSIMERRLSRLWWISILTCIFPKNKFKNRFKNRLFRPIQSSLFPKKLRARLSNVIRLKNIIFPRASPRVTLPNLIMTLWRIKSVSTGIQRTSTTSKTCCRVLFDHQVINKIFVVIILFLTDFYIEDKQSDFNIHFWFLGLRVNTLPLSNVVLDEL